MAQIKVKNVAKRFGDTVALESIELTVANEEFVVLLGASGCGKTTLLRIIAGLETPTEGEVWIGERRVDKLPARSRGIAMVFQNYAVFPHLRVFDNIAFGLRMQKVDDQEIQRRVHRTAEQLHIETLLQRYSAQLSGGQRQRVAVARALAMEPDVILMDEPLSNLDALLRLEMRAELKGILADSQTTTIYVTHDQVEAMGMADRICVLHEGHIVQADSPVAVYTNPATQYVGSFIGSPPMNFLDAERHSDGRWQVGTEVFDGPVADTPTLQMGIRPEDISLTDAGIAAKVVVVEPLGPHTLVSVEVLGKIIRIIVDVDAPISRGDAIRFQPVTARTRWFHPETGQALA